MTYSDRLRYLLNDALAHLQDFSDDAAIECIEDALELLDEIDPQIGVDLNFSTHYYPAEDSPDEDGLDDDQMGALHEKGWN